MDAALPGLLTAAQLYPSLANRDTGFGTATSVALAEIGSYLPAATVTFDTVALPHRLKVILPSKDSTGSSLAEKRRNDAGLRIIGIMSEEAGGCTGIQAVGAWIDPIGGVMHEAVSVIESYSSIPFSDYLLSEVVRIVAEDLDQHTVALVLDSSMYQVTPRR